MLISENWVTWVILGHHFTGLLQHGRWLPVLLFQCTLCPGNDAHATERELSSPNHPPCGAGAQSIVKMEQEAWPLVKEEAQTRSSSRGTTTDTLDTGSGGSGDSCFTQQVPALRVAKLPHAVAASCEIGVESSQSYISNSLQIAPSMQVVMCTSPTVISRCCAGFQG